MIDKFFRLFLPFALALLTLTGCIRYEVGVNFEDQHHGEIVQHIRLGKQLTSLSQSEVNKWVSSIESRAAELQGKAKKVSSQEIAVIIPFNNGKELVNKFNQFFNPDSQQLTPSLSADKLDLVQLKSKITIQQSNLLVLERNHLRMKVDLRALGVLSNQGNIIVSPGSLVDLEFVLNTAWGAHAIKRGNILLPEIRGGGQQLVWQLQPGQINTIEAVFWLPNFLGLGTVGIILLMVVGFYLKYKRWPLVESAVTKI